MSEAQATAEVFVMAIKSLKRREREAVFERLLADTELSEDLADTLALETRRHQPRQSFRRVLKEHLARKKRPSLFDLAKDLCGSVRGSKDLSTRPLTGYGRD